MAHYLAHWKHGVKNELLSNTSFWDVLNESHIDQHCRNAGHQWRTSFWSPTTTVLTLLLQVLDGAKTLRSAVALLLTQLSARGDTDLPSADPAAYCQARKRLPAIVPQQLLHSAATHLNGLLTHDTQWLGRKVWVVDGSNASMPDTPDLQQAFPQHCQKQGCGFPIAQFVVLFCWTTGAIVDVIIDNLVHHEVTLFRKLWGHFRSGDVVLGDRAFGSFADVARLLQRDVFVVSRLHQRRKVDFRAGRRLGKDDALITWAKPPRWLQSMGITEQQFESLPEALTVRYVRISKAPRGFRSQTIVVVTTLLDPAAFPADEIRALYRDRWTAELNLRSIKTHLGMEILRGHSADVVRKEIYMHLIAYNFIRLMMWQAAQRHGRDLHRLSFTGTLHRLRFALALLLQHTIWRVELLDKLFKWIAHDTTPYRPDRIEPRRVKRRPKTYSRLTKPRAYYKQRSHGVDRDAR